MKQTGKPSELFTGVCFSFYEKRARFLWPDRRKLLRNLQKSPEHIYY